MKCSICWEKYMQIISSSCAFNLTKRTSICTVISRGDDYPSRRFSSLSKIVFIPDKPKLFIIHFSWRSVNKDENDESSSLEYFESTTSNEIADEKKNRAVRKLETFFLSFVRTFFWITFNFSIIKFCRRTSIDSFFPWITISICVKQLSITLHQPLKFSDCLQLKQPSYLKFFYFILENCWNICYCFLYFISDWNVNMFWFKSINIYSSDWLNVLIKMWWYVAVSWSDGISLCDASLYWEASY